MAWRQLSTSSLYRQHSDYIRYTCKLQGVLRSFFRKIFGFFHFLDPQNPPRTRICNLSAYTRCPVCPALGHVCPFCPCHPHFLHFVFRSMLISLRLRQVLFTPARVCLLIVPRICRFLTNVRTSIYISECAALPFPARKSTRFSAGCPPDLTAEFVHYGIR